MKFFCNRLKIGLGKEAFFQLFSQAPFELTDEEKKFFQDLYKLSFNGALIPFFPMKAKRFKDLAMSLDDLVCYSRLENCPQLRIESKLDGLRFQVALADPLLLQKQRRRVFHPRNARLHSEILVFCARSDQILYGLLISSTT
jgi:hypothetical protein